MKNTRLTSILGSNLIACALTIGSLASTQFASAQSPTPLAEANIPFAFQTGSQTYASWYVSNQSSIEPLASAARTWSKWICSDVRYN